MGGVGGRPPRIAVRLPNWIGDAVLATPVLRSLRLAYPDSGIDVVAVERTAPLIEADPHIDRVIIIPNRQVVPGGYLRAVAPVREWKYDLGLILPNSFGSALQFALGRVRRRIGYAAELRSPFLTEALRFDGDPRGEHLIRGYLRLAEAAGGRPVPPAPVYYTRTGEEEWAGALLASLGIDDTLPKVGVVPGATFGPAKRWPADRFRRVMEQMVRDGRQAIVLGGPGDMETIGEIFGGGPLPAGIYDLTAKTGLRQTAALMKRLDILLSNDTGPMHLAGAVGTPVIALFGSTNPVWTGPLGPNGVGIRGVANCSPCYLRECPYDLECFRNIDPEAVLAALRNSIDRVE